MEQQQERHGNFTLALVIPCYNEEEALPATLDQLTGLMHRMVGGNAIADYLLVMVDDGSKDRTWQIIAQHHDQDPHIKGVKLAGNAGHQNALMAGLAYAVEKADAIVSIDADLQDDPEAIAEMALRFDEGYDVVNGVRNDRSSDTWFKRNSAQLFYRQMKSLGVRTVYNSADFRLLSRRAAKALLGFRERNLYLRGIVPLMGFRTANVAYARRPRMAGETKYPLGKMVALAANGITSFSIHPIRMILGLGVAFVAISILILIYVVASFALHHTVAGWTSLMLSIWFVGGCLLVSMGVVGEYIGKIYLEVKDRPRYIVEEKLD
ncbi:MAG: glycosyltransferase [Bacteroidales bacterium]|nr:glycosyltransferase family 2 protein [Bacteroidales bacterium]MDD7704885.1 glycosyltransferase [Bacteroidales bacterium]MDY4704835.1 glycosyltransferase [Prevotella sp.]MDY4951938.1 glycosyltransferase [Prevotella sp.]